MTVYFHGNFGLNRPIMAKLLKLCIENPDMRDKELASHFGYGAPFASKYRAWLNKTGFIEQGFPVKLTTSGKAVFEKDPQLNELETMQFMHEQLANDPKKVETWHFFLHEFLPNHSKFTRQELQMALMEKLRAHSEKHFGPQSSMNPTITRKLLECYLNCDALGPLKVLSFTNGKYHSSNK